MHRSVERNPTERSTGLNTEKASIIAGETIAAISTPAGEGAIALVRVSGVDAGRERLQGEVARRRVPEQRVGGDVARARCSAAHVAVGGWLLKGAVAVSPEQ